MEKKKFDKAIIISSGRLGDFISTFVAINPIKELSNSVDIVCKPAYKAIIDNEDNLNYIDVEQVNNKKYDLLLDLTNVASSRELSKKARARIKIGRHRSFLRKIRYYLSGTYTSSHLHKPELFHITEDYYPYTKAVNVDCDTTPRLNKLYSPSLDSLFDIKNKRLICGIHISGTDLVRQIPTPLIQDTIKYIESIGGAAILIGERQKANEIGIDSPNVHYREENINELLATLSQLDYLIGPDSGVLHLASAVGTPALGLYSSVLASASKPPSPLVSFIEKDLDCRPCRNRDGCSYNIRCLNSIDFNEVKTYLEKIPT